MTRRIRHHQPAFDGREASARTELRAINQSPAIYLAGVGARCGAHWDDAFERALDLVDRFGTSRPIRPDDAAHLCGEMRDWARNAGIPSDSDVAGRGLLIQRG